MHWPPRSQYWDGLTVVLGGVELPFEQAIGQLVDSTGRPAPRSGYSIGVSQWLYSGNLPRTASK